MGLEKSEIFVLEIKRLLKKNQSSLILHSAFALSMVYFWKSFNTRVLPGDLGDSRVSLFIMEHWYKFFAGQNSLQNLPMFFPLQNTLSGSDAFFLQGITYSIFRLFTNRLNIAFSAAIVVLHIVGSYSSLKIVGKFKIPVAYQVCIVALYGSLTPFWLCRNHVQLLLFPLLGWIVFFLWMYFENYRFRYLAGAFIITLSITLSAGYAIAFFGFFSLVCFIILKLISKGTKLLPKNNTKQFMQHAAGAVLISSPLFYLFFKLYVSADSLTSSHSQGETLLYSPSVVDLVDVPHSLFPLEGHLNIISRLMEKVNSLPNPTGERGGSFTFFTALLSISVILALLVKLRRLGWRSSSLILKVSSILSLGVILSYTLILKDFRNVNVWILSFYFLPFFGAIRVLSRFTLLVALILPFILGLGLWELRPLKTKSRPYIFFVLMSTGLIFLDQPINLYGSFNSEEIYVLKQIDRDVRSSCSSFYLLDITSNKDLVPSWVVSGDALALSSRTTVPSINGASSFFPPNYPSELYDMRNTQKSILAAQTWAKTNNLKNVCLIEYSRSLNQPGKVANIRISKESL